MTFYKMDTVWLGIFPHHSKYYTDLKELILNLVHTARLFILMAYSYRIPLP